MHFYNEIFKLKNLERTGWKDFDVQGRIESDAEHIFSCLTLALDIINKKKLNLDVEKVLKMLLYHEMGEIDFGDHTPREHLPKEYKHNQEKIGVSRISTLSNNSPHSSYSCGVISCVSI